MRSGNDIGAAGAASLAPSLLRMTQLTSLNLYGALMRIGGQLRCERVLANAGCAWMMLFVVGCGGCARGCSGLWGLCEGRAEGRRCMQTITLEMMGQRRWHRVSEG